MYALPTPSSRAERWPFPLTTASLRCGVILKYHFSSLLSLHPSLVISDSWKYMSLPHRRSSRAVGFSHQAASALLVALGGLPDSGLLRACTFGVSIPRKPGGSQHSHAYTVTAAARCRCCCCCSSIYIAATAAAVPTKQTRAVTWLLYTARAGCLHRKQRSLRARKHRAARHRLPLRSCSRIYS